MAATYHEEAGKGDYRRKEDKKAIDRHWDAIDWSVKATPVCKVCRGHGGFYDAGWWYECPECHPEAYKKSGGVNE